MWHCAGVSSEILTVLQAAQDTSAVAARNTAAAFNNVSLAAKEQYAKALQNERVRSTICDLSTVHTLSSQQAPRRLPAPELAGLCASKGCASGSVPH